MADSERVDFSVKRYNQYSDDELIMSLQKYAKKKKIQNIDSRSFCKWLGVSPSTIQRHFETWAKFCKAAGLSPRYDRDIDRSDLFENLNTAWKALGRQPRAKEMKQPLSPISISRYQKVLHDTWYNICVDFISWKSGASVEEILEESNNLSFENAHKKVSHKTKRGISLSLRYEILKRDDFRCAKCGASPALTSGVELHIDHIVPWSKGGETINSNLQTLCSKCNIGKSDRS